VFYPVQVSKQILDRYQRLLFYRRKSDGEPLSFRSQSQRLVAIRMWFRWLMQQDYITSNPATELQLPRTERHLPKAMLSEREMEIILHQPNITDALGLRDRALLELFYSTGIRRTEMANLITTDIDLYELTVMVRQGKGKTDRLVPMGERAAAWAEKYLYEARNELSCARDNREFFLSSHGLALTPSNLGIIVRKYIEKAGIDKVGSCHLFRHAMATHMLERGADIRFIQEMLGHAKITTTQFYTQVSLKKLKEVHAQTHPAANLLKKEQEPDIELISLEESEAQLLAMLAAEARDDSGQ
jgi:integrase/recombinase XerD